jgi:ABC-type Na+ efflux pump permease subunit
MTESQLPEAPPGPDESPIDREVGHIVLQVAATHVGVCLTGVGLVRLLGQNGTISTAVDDLLAINALGFLVTSVTAYLALRAGSSARRKRLERIADVLFLLCLTLMVVVGALLAYEIL